MKIIGRNVSFPETEVSSLGEYAEIRITDKKNHEMWIHILLTETDLEHLLKMVRENKDA